MKNKFNLKSEKNPIVFGLSGSTKLAEQTAKKAGFDFGEADIRRFQDSEINVEIISSVRSKRVFVIQSTSNPANDYIIELLLFLDALKRASAGEVTVICPYFGYARQDRKANKRTPISARLIADLIITAGADRFVTFDIHSDQIEGFFNLPFDNLRTQGVLAEYFKKNIKYDKKNLVIVSPDHGGTSRARAFAKKFEAPLAVIDKRRVAMNTAEALHLLGDVKGKDVIIFDDMIDTGGTIAEAVKFLKKEKANKIYCVVVHAVLSGTQENPNAAIDKLITAGIDTIITTNTISKIPTSPKIKVVDLSETLGTVLKLFIENKSISEYFRKKWNY